LKRSLQIVGEPNDRTPAEPIVVEVDGQLVQIVDAHDGSAADRLASMLEQSGALRKRTDTETEPALRIVVRSMPQSPEARLRAEVLEESADVVLGSPRKAFATRFVGRAADAGDDSA
jgi:hypothetical protein